MATKPQRLLTARGRTFLQARLAEYRRYIYDSAPLPPWANCAENQTEQLLNHILEADTACPTCAGTQTVPCPDCTGEKP
jgi:hypothetical protein